jgi:DNA (cytosine-5)-methyltransferase 1
VWENVPGVLSSNGGKDFGTFLGALGELGYGFAYRVLDAQHFGVAQRRRRVFVVGYLGDWRVAAAVLFESESLQGNTKPSRKKREEVAPDAQRSVGESGDSQPIAVDIYNYTTNDHTTQTIRSQSDTDHIGAVLQPIAVDVYNQSIDGQTSATITEAVGGTNTSGPKVMQPIPINTMTMLGRPSDDKNPRMGLGIGNPGEPQNTLTKTHSHAVATGMAIRRLTPKECERLQGFPDDWTKIPYRNKEADQCPDGPRYKACGNSMAVPVMRWIGERINLIESML